MQDILTFRYNQKKASLKRIKYIFCINTGRAGSEYLAALLGTAKEVYSCHEPEPQMIGKYLQMVAENEMEATFEVRRIKSKAILKTVSKYSEGTVYAETSNMFIKTFYDVVLHDLENVTVIYLKRDLLQTLKSFIQLCYFSNKNTAWPDWMISPNARTAKIKCIGADHELDFIDLSIAYLIDIEARARVFHQQYQDVTFHEIDINDLNEKSKVRDLFLDIGITFREETAGMIGRKINVRSDKKKKYDNPVDDLELINRFRKYIHKGEELGILFPERVFKYAV